MKEGLIAEACYICGADLDGGVAHAVGEAVACMECLDGAPWPEGVHA